MSTKIVFILFESMFVVLLRSILKMRTLKTIFFFLILSFSAFANDSTKVEFKRFAVGIHASPDYCYRKLSLLASNPLTVSQLDYRNNNEIPMIGYTAGIDLSYYLKKQFAVSLGVNFSQEGYKTKPIPVTTVINPYTEVGKEISRYNFNYIEIPLKANFVFGKKKIRFLASAGITSAFFIYQRTLNETKYDSGGKSTTKEKPDYIYNPFNLFLTGSIGVDFKLGKKSGLKLEPFYSYGLLETINAPITENLSNAGLTLEYYLRF